jgi:hypothetical protein
VRRRRDVSGGEEGGTRVGEKKEGREWGRRMRDVSGEEEGGREWGRRRRDMSRGEGGGT